MVMHVDEAVGVDLLELGHTHAAHLVHAQQLLLAARHLADGGHRDVVVRRQVTWPSYVRVERKSVLLRQLVRARSTGPSVSRAGATCRRTTTSQWPSSAR